VLGRASADGTAPVVPDSALPACNANRTTDSDYVSDVVSDARGAFCPTWTFRGGAVAFQRPTDPPRALVSLETRNSSGRFVSGATVLDASQFSSPIEGGPDFDVIHHGAFADVEFRYFAVDQFAATAIGNAVPHIPPLGGNFMLPTENVDFAANFIGLYPSYGNVTTIATEYTQLRSFEINLRADASPVITLLAGYRHIDLNERIFAESFSSVGFPDNRFSRPSTIWTASSWEAKQSSGGKVAWSRPQKSFAATVPICWKRCESGLAR
jgi:hypothetical protein